MKEKEKAPERTGTQEATIDSKNLEPTNEIVDFAVSKQQRIEAHKKRAARQKKLGEYGEETFRYLKRFDITAEELPKVLSIVTKRFLSAATIPTNCP